MKDVSLSEREARRALLIVARSIVCAAVPRSCVGCRLDCRLRVTRPGSRPVPVPVPAPLPGPG